jgi:hypothetical protein
VGYESWLERDRLILLDFDPEVVGIASQPHRGGDAMLHHRTLNPVVIRDGSPRMELFTSAVMATARTSFQARAHLNINEMTNLARIEWVRPQPAPSSYLDTATEPVSWPQRSGPRPPTGSRPRLPHERAHSGLTPILRPPERITQ